MLFIIMPVAGLLFAAGVLASLYVPNGREVGHDHYHYKLEWLGRLRALGREIGGLLGRRGLDDAAMEEHAPKRFKQRQRDAAEQRVERISRRVHDPQRVSRRDELSSVAPPEMAGSGCDVDSRGAHEDRQNGNPWRCARFSPQRAQYHTPLSEGTVRQQMPG